MEEIKDDMDIGKDDKDAMKGNLSQQGIKASNIDTTGGCDQAKVEPLQAARPKSAFSSNKAKQTQSNIFF